MHTIHVPRDENVKEWADVNIGHAWVPGELEL